MAADPITQRLTAPGAPFEMEAATVAGVPLRVWKHAAPSLAAILSASRAYGDRTLCVYEGERTSFEEHFQRAARLANALVNRFGVRKGDRVAIAMRNYPEWPVAFFGAAAAGAVVVPLNAWGTGTELAHALVDSGSQVLVADAARIERLAVHGGALPIRTRIAVRAESGAAEASLEDLVAPGSGDVDLPDVALGPDDDATIFYSSGTTGRPKGALGTHRNICGNAVSLAFVGARAALRAGLSPEELAARASQPQVQLLSVPLFHVTGCHGVLLGSLVQGGKLVMMHRWDPERALELIESEGVTGFGGVPAMVWQLLDAPSFSKRDTHTLQSISYGGAPAPPALLQGIAEAFPNAAAANGYGITETSSVISLNTGADYRERPESVGLPLPICDLRVVDESGRDLPAGELGELHVRGPNVVKGYWNAAAGTADRFEGGWFETGDLARLASDGFLTIVDRAKDVVIRGGENVYCAEVEGALFEHPDVEEAAVIGVPHPVLGEEVGAVVRLRAGRAPTQDDLRQHVATRLASFKVPTHVWIDPEPLPRNPAGKILKRALRERFIPADG
jgi:long-chain acyl-CoA synthetase